MFLNVETQKLPFILFFWHYLGGEGGGFDDDAEFILTCLRWRPCRFPCAFELWPKWCEKWWWWGLGVFFGGGLRGLSLLWGGGGSPCRLTPNPRRSSGGCSAAERGDYISKEGHNREGFWGGDAKGGRGVGCWAPAGLCAWGRCWAAWKGMNPPPNGFSALMLCPESQRHPCPEGLLQEPWLGGTDQPNRSSWPKNEGFGAKKVPTLFRPWTTDLVEDGLSQPSPEPWLHSGTGKDEGQRMRCSNSPAVLGQILGLQGGVQWEALRKMLVGIALKTVSLLPTTS